MIYSTVDPEDFKPWQEAFNAQYALNTVLPGMKAEDLRIFPNEDLRKNAVSYKDLFTQLFRR